MPKLNKRYYYNSLGEKKLNCYGIIIPKEEVEKAGIKETDELEVIAQEDKLIIKKKGGK